MRNLPRTIRIVDLRLLAALLLVGLTALAACGATSASAPKAATAVHCSVPNDGKTAFTSLDGTYKVTVPKGWSATCFASSPFSDGIVATAPDGRYSVYVLPARPMKVPSGSDGLQLFVQNMGPAFLANHLRPDSVTPCCVATVDLSGTTGIDVQFDVSNGGVTSDAEFLAVAHDESPFLILGLLPNQASGPEDAQLQTMIFSSFAFL